jgi:aspartate carbamoyltransferase catalytic subunit
MLLDASHNMKKIVLSGRKADTRLRGKTIVNMFFENSTRTRISFELAAKYLGAHLVNMAATGSSVSKGETLIDTGKNIAAMGVDAMVIRHWNSGAPHLLARNVSVPVINAGDGMNEHPTQALLDMFTMREKKGTLKGLKVAILGDIYHSRVARSNIWGLTKMGAEVSLAGPATLMPPDIEKTGAKVFNTIHEALIDADVVMALRLQLERQKKALFPTVREYSRFFGLDENRLQLAKKDALIMHPGPINRGVELTSAVAGDDNSVIEEQVTNGVAIRMALLYLLTRRNSNEASN